MSGWQLGVDLGTTNTVAAVRRGDALTTVDVESSGNSRMPSSVFLTEAGELLVGTAAVHQAVFAPERYEPTPKRAIGEGEIFLGDRLVTVTEIVTALLKRVYVESCRQQGESTPDAFVLTHPADWSDGRLQVLRDAAQSAALPELVLVPEPVAAAIRIASSTVPGAPIAVYDFGGGTFDAAVLRRTPSGFDVAGPPAGRDPLGGEDVDQKIITHIGEVLDAGAAWEQLVSPTDVAWRRHAASLRVEVQRAKETLSEVTSCQLWVPGLDREVQLTRPELEELIAPEIEATIQTLEVALVDAKVRADELAGLYLVGGSSRIPLVADLLWRRLGVRPSVQDDPKAVVALGAARWSPGERVVVPAARATTAVASVRAQSDLVFTPLVAADVRPRAWPAGCLSVGQLVLDVDGGEPSTIRARDEPARHGSVRDLAAEVGRFRAARTPGYREMTAGPSTFLGTDSLERRFSLQDGRRTVVMIEQYVLVAGRAIVVAYPEQAASVATTMSLTEAPETDTFALRFAVALPPRWWATETLRVARAGSPHALLVERTRPPDPPTAEGWRGQRLQQLRSQYGRDAALAGRSTGDVLDSLPGAIDTIRWSRKGVPTLTKLGTAVLGGDAVAVTIVLPSVEQSMFASLAKQALVHPAARQ